MNKNLIPTKLLTGDALEKARRIVDLEQELAERREALQKRVNDEYEEIRRAIFNEGIGLFHEILQQYGIPAEEHGAWSLHTGFLADHGIAVLVPDPAAATAAAYSERLTSNGPVH